MRTQMAVPFLSVSIREIRGQKSSQLAHIFCETLSGCANYLNPKSEARNKCKIPILKFSKPARPVVSNFEFFSFGFVSDFDIRISDLVAACRAVSIRGFTCCF
jgi:hypothetical protein